MEYKVITKDNENEVWARGFYNEHGRETAERMIAEQYWHQFMYEKDKGKVLVVVPVEKK